ncbi:MAG: DUF2207 domain-containing protein [Vicinamibacterales bacterium]
MIWRLIAAFVVAAAVVVGAAKEHVAERFDVNAVVRPDGSLEVVETIAFRFTGGEFTRVTRELRTRETDGVDVIEASMDGRTLPHGDDEGQVEIDPGRSRTRIVWHFAPARDAVHVFSLRYRYVGVVRYGDGEDWIKWPPFPTRFDYPIEAGSVRLTWPATARPRRSPDVEGSIASTSPIDNGIAMTVANYRQRDDDVVLTARFEPGAFPAAEPQWQRDERRADRLAPAFVAGAVMIGAATVLALWLLFLRYRRDPAEAPLPSGSVASPPDDLPPAMAGAIAWGRVSVSGPQLLGAAFDLARRGSLKIEERPATGFLKKRAFAFRRGHEQGLRPHERGVLDALFKGNEQEAPFHKALQRLAGRSGQIKTVLEGELAEAGFIDRDRKDAGRALIIAGVVVVVFAMLLAIVAMLSSLRLGETSIVIPVAFGLSGMTMVITGTAFSTLTRAGRSSARRWDAYRRYLRDQAKQGRVPVDGEEIGRMLPYAAALGVLARFGKALEKRQVENLPPWLRTLDAAGGSAAMVAMIAAGSSSVSHGGSGGGGGASGSGAGGSSSAG